MVVNEDGTMTVTTGLSVDSLLVGLADQGCISLVALTPTRFAVPENPALILDFELDGNLVQRLMLRGGPLAVTYLPGLSEFLPRFFGLEG